MSTTMPTRETSARFARLRPLAFGALALASSCVDPDQFLPPSQSGGPAGALSGTVAYSGPLPCTENGYIVGAAVMLVFDTRLLPPPEGLGTTAASLTAVGGEQLFAGVKSRLTFNKDGSRWCPAAGTDPVTVSADWAVAPLPGGQYEVRSFYDYDGNFDPVLTIFRLPSKGDIAGGAVENPTEVLQGKAPVYRRITLGVEQADGTYKIPEEGSHVGGVTVNLALPLPLNLPIFYPKSVSYSTKVCDNGTVKDRTTPAPTDPDNVTMPQDYTLPVFAAFDPAGTEDSLIRIGLGAGVAPDEVDAASQKPFNLPVKDPAPTFRFTWQDVNGDGMLDIGADHVPDSTLIPSLFPLSILAKLDDTPTDDYGKALTAQSAPVVIIQGLTIYKDLVSTALSAPDLDAPDTKVTVGVRPATLCLDPNDATKHAKLVITHLKDCGGNTILTDAPGTLNALKKQFNREVDLVEGCLPKGRYAMNLVYGTGQAWTVPNEAGVCSPQEPANKDNTMCVAAVASRARLPSQDVVLTIGDAEDPTYCTTHPTPDECLPPKAAGK
jgi:hypothetical protein